MKLELSLNELHKLTECEEVWFWGKIIGNVNDYYLVLLVNYTGCYEFPKRTFYYCTSTNWIFSPLPDISELHIEDNEKSQSTFFLGKPEEILVLHQDPDNPDSGNPDPDPGLDMSIKNKDPLDFEDSDDEDKKIVVEKPKDFTGIYLF